MSFPDVKPSQLINSNRAAFWIPGFAMASWGPFIPYVKERFALTEDHLGLLLMCIAVGAALAMAGASYLLKLPPSDDGGFSWTKKQLSVEELFDTYVSNSSPEPC